MAGTTCPERIFGVFTVRIHSQESPRHRPVHDRVLRPDNDSIRPVLPVYSTSHLLPNCSRRRTPCWTSTARRSARSWVPSRGLRRATVTWAGRGETNSVSRSSRANSSARTGRWVIKRSGRVFLGSVPRADKRPVARRDRIACGTRRAFGQPRRTRPRLHCSANTETGAPHGSRSPMACPNGNAGGWLGRF